MADHIGNFRSSAPGTAAVTASATGRGPGSNALHGITSSTVDSAVYGEHTGAGIGVFGQGGPNGGQGVFGQTASNSSGVYGKNTNTSPVVQGDPGAKNAGVIGESGTGAGVYGISSTGVGIVGESPDGVGIFGSSPNSVGVAGMSTTFFGLLGGGAVGVYAHSVPATTEAYLGTRSFAGDFHGDVSILGAIHKSGGGFRIDHPLDAAMKYLSHSFVESPDMKNMYDGIAVLDASGEAEVELPAWFDTLNTDVRYQLTCIGGYAPVYIAQEVHGNHFTIAGGTAGLKVCWQVTGIRQDAWANAHRIPVETEKPAEERGYYLHPELYGASDEKHIRHVRYPEQLRQKKLKSLFDR